jgi:putative ABC transport system substrate-binding protein
MAAILFLSVLGNRVAHCNEAKEQHAYRVGIVQFAESPDLDEARRGLVEVIQQGLAKKQAMANVEWASAGSELLGITAILQGFMAKRPDILVTLSSPCLEQASQIIDQMPTVFGVCVNPKIIGFDDNHPVYMRNFTGIYGESPIGELFRIMSLVKPRIKTVAVLWNPSEINSRYEMGILRTICRRHNLNLFEERLRRPGQIRKQARALLEFDPDILILFTDYTVMEGFSSISSLLTARRIPVFTTMTSLVEKGALFGLGFDHYSWGQAAGRMVLEILGGKSPRDVPVRRFEDLNLIVNTKVARQLNLSIPKEVLERATHVIN